MDKPSALLEILGSSSDIISFKSFILKESKNRLENIFHGIWKTPLLYENKIVLRFSFFQKNKDFCMLGKINWIKFQKHDFFWFQNFKEIEKRSGWISSFGKSFKDLLRARTNRAKRVYSFFSLRRKIIFYCILRKFKELSMFWINRTSRKSDKGGLPNNKSRWWWFHN